MSKFFSFKLYLQGLKKSRLQGIAITAIVTALTALVPLTQLLSPRYYEPGVVPTTTIIGYIEFAIPLMLLLFLTPILTLSMFSFLNKRSESDFYHSIPFTRPCVYFSFLAAIMTWVSVALVLAVAVTTVLWWMVPYTAVSLSVPLVHLLVYFLSTLLLTAFTVVAMTLTGTMLSNLLIFALLFSFVRIAGALFVACMESKYPIMVLNLTPARFLQPDFNLPLSLVSGFLFGMSTTAFSNYSLWIYTAVVSIALIAAGCVLYTKRHSEMAGQSAPNRILQHIYRCMISMPMAFVIAYYIIEVGLDLDMLLVLTVITLLIYYIYELLTTKRLKNLLSATLYLPVLLVGGILFGLSITITGNAAVNYTPDADELESVSVYNSYGSYYNPPYEELNIQSVAVNHPEVLEFISKELKEMKATIQSSDAAHYLYPDRYYHTEDDIMHGYREDYYLWTVKITHRSGKVCGRTLCLTATEFQKLNNFFVQTEEYEAALLALPTQSEILNIETNFYSYQMEDALQSIWESFVKEFEALPHEQKILYKTEVLNNSGWSQYEINVQGMKGTDSFRSSYPLSLEYFPKTCRMYIEAFNSIDREQYSLAVQALQSDTQYTGLNIECGDGYYSSSGQTELIRQAVEFLENCQSSTDATAQFTCVYLEVESRSEYLGGQKYYLLSQEDIAKLFSILQIDDYGGKEPITQEKPIVD